MNLAFFLLIAAVPVTAECGYQSHYDCVTNQKEFEDYQEMIQPLNNAIFNLINEAHERDLYNFLYPVICELLEARSKLVTKMEFEQIDCRIPKKRIELPH